MSMTQKERVLAKCGELAPKRNQRIVVDSSLYVQNFLGYEKVTAYNIVSKFGAGEDTNGVTVTECRVSPALPDDHWNWPLAAQILQIGEEERPCNDLLWEAFKKGNEAPKMNITLLSLCFDSWLATLPADPLEADRELIRKELIETVEDSPYYPNIDEREKAIHTALKRLAGLEVHRD